MTLEEKVSLCSGLDHWNTKPVERLNIPSIRVADGPNGVRRASGSSYNSVALPATCFPTASALGASWDTALVRITAEAIAEECRAFNIQILLGPGVNMKRSPMGGRNFEYFSEDPVLSGKLAAAYIKGIQSRGVGTSLKHFAVNNQEFERYSYNAVVDERTMHELYLTPFEIAVKEAQPWTMMCAYNKINGELASENSILLHDILKKQWGFKGIVISDWGAVDNRIKGIEAGLHLEMPGNDGVNDRILMEAVRNGSLPESRLDEIVTELVAITDIAKDAFRINTLPDQQKQHDLVRKISGECIVLLKNKDNILPLPAAKIRQLAVIGAFAMNPRFEGSGSSKVTPAIVDTPFKEIKKLSLKNSTVSYAAGYTPEATTSDTLIEEAKANARKANVAIIFAGLPDVYEAEGVDRKNIKMPEAHIRLIEEVTKVQPNTVVVLMNGAAIEMPWANKVKAIVEAWLGGQAGGGAIADVLYGKINPSGKLSETFWNRTEDTPVYPGFPVKDKTALYGEGIFVGYRYCDSKKITPLFPFGYGLSYTTFAYSGIKTNKTSAQDTTEIIIECKVRNTGKIAGMEIVQLYVRNENEEMIRPEKELKHFAKVLLQPGEEKTVHFKLNFRDFAYYDPQVHAWQTSNGKYIILAGGSSQNLPLKTQINISPANMLYPKLTRYSMLKEFAKNPANKALYNELMNVALSTRTELTATGNETEQERKGRLVRFTITFNNMPVYKLIARTKGKFTEDMLAEIIKRAE
ncbi:glycosyl hydrolase [Niastella caeni]|uniref:Glycosyl hydrolase n=2 Tax=Niastella caeni TaxID=2569763 RepID=A0A4S8HLR2_9BACT|nr:glycosyl hydrolase [Niastella caeni]